MLAVNQMTFPLAHPGGRVAGVDEAGRGPLAGPVVAAAVILDPDRPVAGLADSKTLSAARRAELYERITECALAWAVGRAEVAEIDSVNILNATFLAMQRAVAALTPAPDHVLVDGNQAPVFECTATAIVGGDGLDASIGAASIVAKHRRDVELLALDEEYPGYGFAAHKGYATAAHVAALYRLGPCPAHRRTFRPVKDLLAIPEKRAQEA